MPVSHDVEETLRQVVLLADEVLFVTHICNPSWMVRTMPELGRGRQVVSVLYGSKVGGAVSGRRIQFSPATVPSGGGVMHANVVLALRGDYITILVHTANLCDTTGGLSNSGWSQRFRIIGAMQSSAAGSSEHDFGRILEHFVQQVAPPAARSYIAPFVSALQMSGAFDCAECRLVPAIPGESHSGRCGQDRLAELVRVLPHWDSTPQPERRLHVAVSSLGQQPDAVLDEVATGTGTLKKNAAVHWPTPGYLQRSAALGGSNGGSLHGGGEGPRALGPDRVIECQPVSDQRVPHFKYIVGLGQGCPLWLCMGSANLSGGALGRRQGGVLICKNFELSVLLVEGAFPGGLREALPFVVPAASPRPAASRACFFGPAGLALDAKRRDEWDAEEAFKANLDLERLQDREREGCESRGEDSGGGRGVEAAAWHAADAASAAGAGAGAEEGAGEGGGGGGAGWPWGGDDEQEREEQGDAAEERRRAQAAGEAGTWPVHLGRQPRCAWWCPGCGQWNRDGYHGSCGYCDRGRYLDIWR
jgi:hypothetical protein